MGKGNRGKRRGKTPGASKPKDKTPQKGTSMNALKKVKPSMNALKKVKPPQKGRFAGRLGEGAKKPKILKKSKTVLSSSLAARVGTKDGFTSETNINTAVDARSIIDRRTSRSDDVHNPISDLRQTLKTRKEGNSQTQEDQKQKLVITVDNQRGLNTPAQNTATPTRTKSQQNSLVKSAAGKRTSTKPFQVEYTDSHGRQCIVQQDQQQLFTWQFPQNKPQTKDPFQPVISAPISDPKLSGEPIAHPLTHSTKYEDKAYKREMVNPKSDLEVSYSPWRARVPNLPSGDTKHEGTTMRSPADPLPPVAPLPPADPLPPPHGVLPSSSSNNLGLYSPQLWSISQNDPFREMYPQSPTTLAAPEIPFGSSKISDNSGNFDQDPNMNRGDRLPRSIYKVGVSNLHTAVDIDDIYSLFGDVGEVLSVEILASGVAEISFATYRDVVQAVEVYHQRLLDDRPMYVEYLGQVSW